MSNYEVYLALDIKEEMRDKAFIYLKNAINQIRVCGKFVCRPNPERLKGYISEYIKAKNRQNRTVKDTTPVDALTTK